MDEAENDISAVSGWFESVQMFTKVELCKEQLCSDSTGMKGNYPQVLGFWFDSSLTQVRDFILLLFSIYSLNLSNKTNFEC